MDRVQIGQLGELVVRNFLKNQKVICQRLNGYDVFDFYLPDFSWYIEVKTVYYRERIKVRRNQIDFIRNKGGNSFLFDGGLIVICVHSFSKFVEENQFLKEISELVFIDDNDFLDFLDKGYFDYSGCWDVFRISCHRLLEKARKFRIVRSVSVNSHKTSSFVVKYVGQKSEKLLENFCRYRKCRVEERSLNQIHILEDVGSNPTPAIVK